MSTASISGLSSGLDTAGIIDSLMQLEAAPQTKLKTTLTTQQSNLKSLQALNAKVADLTTQAKALASGTGWGALKATSSSPAVAVTTTSGSTNGAFSFTVNQTAVSHKLTFTSTAKSTDVVVSGGTTVDLTAADGTVKTLETGSGTLDGLVNALNGSGTGVTAAKVKLDDGSYRLVVNAGASGAASAFTLTNTDGTDLLGGATAVQGADAEIQLGTDLIHSATNTFAGVIPGVDFTVSAAAVTSPATPVTITVDKDTAAVKTSVKSLVDAINTTLTQIDTLSSYNATTKTAGPLAGDANIRSLRNALLNSVYPTDGKSLADVGIQTDRSGKLVFDDAAFSTAYAADPAGVASRFTAGASGSVDGFAQRVSAVGTQASDKYSGTLTAAVTGRTSEIDRLSKSIDDWDLRLELHRASLQQRFTALETALNNMKSQSSWLSGQINSLPGSSA